MSKVMLCDVNVWLDYFFDDRLYHDSARRLVRRGCKYDVRFMVPASSLSDFYYLSVQNFKQGFRERYGGVTEAQGLASREGAWAAVQNLLSFVTAVGADMSDAEIALKYKTVHADYEDDLILAAALRSNPDCLVTRDKRLREVSPVMALDPDEAIAFFGLDQ